MNESLPPWRSPLVWAAVIVFVGLVLHGLLPRYVPNGDNFVLDTWTGRTCLVIECAVRL